MVMSCYSAILSISVARLGTSGSHLLKTCSVKRGTEFAGLLQLPPSIFHQLRCKSLVGSTPSTKVDRGFEWREIVGPKPGQSRRLCSKSSSKGTFKPDPLPLLTTGNTRRNSTRNMSCSSEKLKIVIFYGSTRQGRMCDRVGIAVTNAVKENGHEAIVLDPLKLPVEMLKLPLHFMPNPAEAPQWLLDTNDTIKNADGFIFISAEYNCSLPPALSNLVDHFPPPSFRHRPVAIVTYSLGQFGGTRAAVLLRPFASELGMFSIPATVPIPVVNNVVDEKGNVLEERVTANITKLIKELAWYATGLKAHKSENPPPT